MTLLIICVGKGNHEDYSGDFGATGSETDIKLITECYSEDSANNNELELKYAQIYTSITADNSEKAIRIIGDIEGRPIPAKMLELEALKVQIEDGKNVYAKAWKRLKISIKEEIIAKQYGIEYEMDALAAINQTRDMMRVENDTAVIKYFHDLYAAFGMSEDQYWEEYAFRLMSRQILHQRVDQYLKEHHLPSIRVEKIDGELRDAEYLEKIGQPQKTL